MELGEVELKNAARLAALGDMIREGSIMKTKGGQVGFADTVEHLQTHSPVTPLVTRADGTVGANGWISKKHGIISYKS